MNISSGFFKLQNKDIK